MNIQDSKTYKEWTEKESIVKEWHPYGEETGFQKDSLIVVEKQIDGNYRILRFFKVGGTSKVLVSVDKRDLDLHSLLTEIIENYSNFLN